jgi:hypothetical protein
MAIGEAPVLETLADLTAVSVLRSELDAQSLLMVRLAALIAVDAPAASYLLQAELLDLVAEGPEQDSLSTGLDVGVYPVGALLGGTVNPPGVSGDLVV